MQKHMMRLMTGLILVRMLTAAGLDGPTAAEIVQKVEAAQDFVTCRSRVSMTIYPNRDHEERSRTIGMISYQRGQEDSFMSIVQPRSIKGLRILSKKRDQWIYFPSTGRIRKIASRTKDDSMGGVGGDFSNEDMEAGKWQDKYDFTIQENQPDHWVLQATPRAGRYSTYSRMQVTVRKRDFQILRIGYFSEKQGFFKELIMSDFCTISGRVTPMCMTMTNLAKNSKTVMRMEETEYDVQVEDKYFDPVLFSR